MLNDGKTNVPDNTIALFKVIPENIDNPIIDHVIQPSTKKREWFSPVFYRCLPLTVGNQYGFMIHTGFDFEVVWNGGDSPGDIQFNLYGKEEEITSIWPSVESHFGHGVITLNLPYILRTPPGINIMTINPPNVILNNLTVMTGVVETDNLRYMFTFNLKIQEPNIVIRVPKGTPLAAFIPIPRYFVDGFKLMDAENIFSDEVLLEEAQAFVDMVGIRNNVEKKMKSPFGKRYFKGIDAYGNKFKDHQGPNMNRKQSE